MRIVYNILTENAMETTLLFIYFVFKTGAPLQPKLISLFAIIYFNILYTCTIFYTAKIYFGVLPRYNTPFTIEELFWCIQAIPFAISRS